MKLEIIETPDYILAVSDEEIKDRDTNLTNGRDIFDYRDVKEYSLEYANRYWQKIIGYQPKDNAKELDGLPLLPEMENDVEKLLDEKYPYEIGYSVSDENSTIQAMREAFTEGHKAATKTFSEEDLRKAFERGFSVATYLADYETEKEWSKFINSLKQPVAPKWFVAEHIGKCCGNQLIKQCIDCKKYKPQLKTTTINGKSYLVGKYE